MSTQAKITLRPPAHRSFLNGYPGIPSCNPSSPNATVPADPFVKLPVHLRPQAHLSGTVEMRPSLKGGGTRAKWLRVEARRSPLQALRYASLIVRIVWQLEKIETVPAQAGSAQSKGKVNTQSRFIELIGNGPGILWEAPTTAGAGKKKGKKGKEDDEEGWDFIPEGNYPFRIPLPEGLPPTTEVDSQGSGVSYQLVATLCGKGKKGLLKSAKVEMLTNAAPVLLLKADMLPTWPAYAPILPTPLPLMLPWANPNGLTTGETRESRIRAVGSEGSGGEVWMKCTRETGAVGPGDGMRVRVQIGWGGSNPVKLTSLDFVLRETLVFRCKILLMIIRGRLRADSISAFRPDPPPPGNNAPGISKSQPRTINIFTAEASVSSDPDNPLAPAVLIENEPLSFDLTGIVPASHGRVTVRTAKHVDVAYSLKIRGVLEGGEEISVEKWSVFVGGAGRREAKGLMEEIGWVDGLCDRPGLVVESSSLPPSSPQTATNPTASSQTATSLQAPTPPVSSPTIATSSQRSSPSPSSPVAAPATMQLPKVSTAIDNRLAPPASLSARVPDNAASSSQSVSTYSQVSDSTPDLGIDVIAASEQRRSDSPPPPVAGGSGSHLSAESEKRRLYENAARMAATQQQFRVRNADNLEGSPEPVGFVPPPNAELEKTRLFEAAQSTRDRLQSEASGGTDLQARTVSPAPNEDEKAALHRAAVMRRDQLQQTFSPSSAPTSECVKTQLFDNAVEIRDELQRYANGAISSPPAVPTQMLSSSTSSATTHQPRTSLGSPESEKKRQLQSAKDAIRRRQEEARIEFEKQNALLAEMEAEEARLAEDPSRSGQEEESFQTRVTNQQEQADRAQAEEQWRREEQARQEATQVRWHREEQAREDTIRANREEELRKQERQLQAEQRRFAEQQRQHQARLKSEMLLQRNSSTLLSIDASPYDLIRSSSDHSTLLAPTPQNPAQTNRLNSHGSFSPELSSEGHEFAPSSQSYPVNAGSVTSLPRHLVGQDRPTSAASFAPTTPMDQANHAYYVNAIANASASNSTAQAEKEAYLLKLRQGSASSLGSQPTRPPRRHPLYENSATVAPGSFPMQGPIDSPLSPQQYQQNYPSPAQHHFETPSNLTSATSVIPPHFIYQPVLLEENMMSARQDSGDSYASPNRQPVLSATSPTSHQMYDEPQQWKTALQEKEEEKARREEEARAEVRGGKQVAVESELPTYQTDSPCRAAHSSAAQEKAAMTARAFAVDFVTRNRLKVFASTDYERAKAEVEAFQRGPPPPPPPPRQRSGYEGNQHSTSPLQVAPSSQSHKGERQSTLSLPPPSPHVPNNGSTHPLYGQHQSSDRERQYYSSPPQSPLHPIREIQQFQRPLTPPFASSPPKSNFLTSTSGNDHDSDGSSSDYHRDPLVKSGKQRSRTMDVDGSEGGGDLAAFWSMSPVAEHSNRISAPWMLSQPDFGNFSLDGISSSFEGLSSNGAQ